MTFDISVVNLRPSSSTSSVRAYADVRLSSDVGVLRINGISVIQVEGKQPFVALPQKPGKNGKKYFPVNEAEGKLKGLIADAVLDAFQNSKN
jgi:DNA-binding cell septation regulator SpoVG